MQKSLIITVTYSQSRKFSLDYFDSIKKQKLKLIDILILNDNENKKFISNQISGLKNVKIINIKNNFTFSQIRNRGINYAKKNNYKNIIFADYDDYFSKNRIEETIKSLMNYDFVFNEIKNIDKKNKIYNKKKFYERNIKINNLDFNSILNHNIIGTNSGISIKALKNINVPKNIIAYDWWIFTCLLLQKNKGKLIKNAYTYYRQHEDNMIGINNIIDKKKILFGIKVKLTHYENLINFSKINNFKSKIKIYKMMKNKMVILKKQLLKEKFMKEYIKVIKNNYDIITKGWWGYILTLDEYYTLKYFEIKKVNKKNK